MLSRGTAKERAKLRRHNEQLVRRSPILTNGAKLLWLELSAWAWDDPTCFPKQELLVLALGKERTTVSRWIGELKKHKLITVRRQRRGNRYVLSDVVPEEVCDPARGFNRELVRILRAQGDVAETQHQDAESGFVELPDCTQDVAKTQHDPLRDVAKMQHPDVAKMQHPIDEVHQGEVHQENKGSRSKEEEHELRSATHATEQNEKSEEVSARCARGSEGSEADQKQRTSMPESTQPEDLGELMEDPPVKMQNKRRKPKRRGPSSDLVGLPGDDRRATSKPRGDTPVVEAAPPPPKAPEDVLALLRGEIEEKYGADACRKIPLALTKKDRGSVRNSVLAKYAPDVVIGMVRVLVWDWEVARATIFPFRIQVKIPTIEAFVQYQETLASVVDVGLKYDGSVRGEWVTYSTRYLVDANPSKVEEDPF